jgi:putative FmdB family regulatory protein
MGMPIFEYHCRECEHAFEVLILPRSPEPRCPECESKDIEKLLSAPTMSSDGTKERARQSGLARNRKLGVEKSRADHEYYHKHTHDH